MLRLALIPLLLATIAVPALADTGGGASSSATPAPRLRHPFPVGIQDQDYGDFTTARWRQIGWRRVRYIVRWDVALRPRDREYLDQYLAAARAARIEPFIALDKLPSMAFCPAPPCWAPSVRAYARAFRAFHRRWPQVRLIAPWNEANHRSQPTWTKPRRAAQYYNVVRRYCRRCKIVAADVIDETNMVRWLRTFKRYAKRPKLWGLHNYRDTNPRRGQIYGGTRRMLRAVRGPIWLTETGGIVFFQTIDGNTLFPYSERRAARALKRMFKLAKRYRSRVKRLYIYDWRQPAASEHNRFDAGLVSATDRPRPGFYVVRRALRGRTFRP